MSDTIEIFGMGWTRDNPDSRDYTENSENVKPLLQELTYKKSSKAVSSMFGFTVYSSYSQTSTNGGKFPYLYHNF